MIDNIDRIYDVAIVGGGPAGLTAAIYCARDNRSVVVFEKETFGGRITETPVVNNIPGFDEISGVEFGSNLETQAANFGAELCFEEIFLIDVDDDLIRLQNTYDDIYYAKTCIIATGTKNRTLNTRGEEELIGNGIHFCVTCDGPFYKDKDVVVIGGGNSALTEALELSHIANKVAILQDMPFLTGEQKLVEQIEDASNIEVITNIKVSDIRRIEKDKLMLMTNQGRLYAQGVFEAIGFVPQNSAFENILDLDTKGYIISPRSANIFACGDCVSESVQQVVVACGEGAKAALKALRNLRERP